MPGSVFVLPSFPGDVQAIVLQIVVVTPFYIWIDVN